MFKGERPSLDPDYGNYIGNMVKLESTRVVNKQPIVKQTLALVRNPEPDQINGLDGDGFVDRRFNPYAEPKRAFDEEAKARAESEGMVARNVQRRIPRGQAVRVSR